MCHGCVCVGGGGVCLYVPLHAHWPSSAFFEGCVFRCRKGPLSVPTNAGDAPPPSVPRMVNGHICDFSGIILYVSASTPTSTFASAAVSAARLGRRRPPPVAAAVGRPHGSLEGVRGLKTNEAYHSKADALPWPGRRAVGIGSLSRKVGHFCLLLWHGLIPAQRWLRPNRRSVPSLHLQWERWLIRPALTSHCPSKFLNTGYSSSPFLGWPYSWYYSAVVINTVSRSRDPSHGARDTWLVHGFAESRPIARDTGHLLICILSDGVDTFRTGSTCMSFERYWIVTRLYYV